MNTKLKKVIIGTTIATSLLSFSITDSFASYLKHRVVSGDTLWKLSTEYQTSLDELYRINPRYLYNSSLNIGETVNIPSKVVTYVVQRGDTPWIISNKFGITLQHFMSSNNLKDGQHIFPGNTVIVPSPNSNNSNSGSQSFTNYTVKSGDTTWTISNAYKMSMNDLLAFNGLTQKDYIYPGQVLKIPKQPIQNEAPVQQQIQLPSPSTPQKSFITHRVVNGDDLWKISIKYGIPFHELLKLNGFRENHVVNIGDQIKIPVYNIPVKQTRGPQFGELLDWWTEAQYVLPIGKEFKIIDFYTGKQWFAKRTIGANHADCEPLTSKDASIMKEVWGGNYSWATRPVIIEVNGRRLAASMSSLPHDIQYITNNNFQGHFDLYFSNSTRHVDGKPDARHQKNVIISAGN